MVERKLPDKMNDIIGHDEEESEDEDEETTVDSHLPDESFFEKILIKGMSAEDRARVKAIYVDEIVERHRDDSYFKGMSAKRKAAAKAAIVEKARSYACEEARRIRAHMELRAQVRSNDPKMQRLTIGPRDTLDVENFPTRDWEAFGKEIGKNTQLKELEIRLFGEADAFYDEEEDDEDEDINEEDMKDFLCGVAENRSIEKLVFNNFHLFSAEGFEMLGDFFSNNRNNFKSLSIVNCMLGDLHSELASALAGFTSLTEFVLSHRHGKTPWEEMCDKKAAKIISALAGHSGLRKLALPGNQIGTLGCATLATTGLLQNPESRLMDLDLTDNPINDSGRRDADLGAQFLASALLGNTSLTRLSLGCTDISAEGWTAMIAAFKSSTCRLEHLDLSMNSFDDSTFTSLSNVLAKKCTLKSLELRECEGVTAEGFSSISLVLRNPDMMLEKLDLTDNDNIDDEVAISYANALSHNKKLRSIILDDNDITPRGWAAFSRALCNKSSYVETYHSNHTVKEIGWHEELPQDLELLLQLNRENSEGQAAQQKVVQNFLHSISFCG